MTYTETFVCSPAKRHCKTRLSVLVGTLRVNSPFLFFFVIALLLPQSVLTQDKVYSFREEEPEGAFVGNIARDLNLEAIIPASVFQSLQYSILVWQDGDYFRVDSDNSDLFTRSVLDREQICRYESQCVLNLRVGARSDTDLRKYTIAVNLLDINDNSPRFNQSSFTLRIPESVTAGKKYTLPGALDEDRGADNSIQFYSLSSGDGRPVDGSFEVEYSQKLDGTSDVSLVVTRALDRETQDRYALTLTAVDGGDDPAPRRGSMDITVVVEDDNDHTPTFDQAKYSVQVGENTASGAVIKTLTARDGDIGANAALQYRLSVHQDASVAQQFEVNPQTGTLTARVALTSGSYTIIVEAVDGGSPQRVNQTVVEVTVIDTENNPPVITVDPLNEGSPWALISEGANFDDLVAHVTVYDPDSGPNGAVLCYSQSAFFDLHPQEDNDYLVVVAKGLDREDTPEFRVTLFCEDSGTPKLNDTKVFDVLVKDENDNPPILTNGDDVTVTLPENNAINDVVTIIEATDADTGDNAALQFSLLDDSDGFFQIPKGSNVLLCSKVLDRETGPSHVVKVLVQDGGDSPESATGTVTISVLDVNDVRPKFFQARYSFSILEDLPAGSMVGTVSAFDLDLGDSGLMDFSIPSWSDGRRKFQMSKNGSLTTSASLDREDIAVHNFVAEVTDRGRPPLSSQVRIEVKVIDKNDNSPEFQFPSASNSTVTLFLPVSAAKTVVVVQAKDADHGRNGEVRYILARQNSSLFTLDPVLGELVTARKLTTQDVGIYNLTVTASDAGLTPLTTTKKFSVIVKVDPGLEAVKDSDSNAVIAIALVCGTAALAALLVAVVCYLKRRDRSGDKGNPLRYLDSHTGTGENCGAAPQVLDVNSLPNQYDEHKEPNNNISLSNGKEPYAKYSVPKLSVGFPGFDHDDLQSTPGVRSSVGSGVKGDEMDFRDKELNRVTSLRLQQAFEHISSIKSRLITPSDTSKPYEWREIHIPGHPGDFGSLSSRGTANTTTNTHSNSNGNYNPYTLDSGIGTDDDAVFTTTNRTSSSSNNKNNNNSTSGSSPHNKNSSNGDIKSNGHPRLQHHHSTNSYNSQYNIHRRNNNNNNRNFRSASTTSDRAYRSRLGAQNSSGGGGGGGFNTMPSSSSSSPARHKPNHHHHHYRPNHHNSSITSTPHRRLFSSQPSSDISGDSSQPSCASLPNLYLKPGSETFVFRPLSARSSDSFPSETLDDQCTTTSGSYSLTMDDQHQLQHHHHHKSNGHHHHHHHHHPHHPQHQNSRQSPSHRGGTPQGGRTGGKGRKDSLLQLGDLNYIQDVYV